jgi:lysozyme
MPGIRSFFRATPNKIKRKVAAGSVAGLATTVAFVTSWEGKELDAYYDVVGVPTICQGLTKGVKIGDRMTSEECDKKFTAALAEYEKGIAACIRTWDRLPTNTKIAVVSWTYNVGIWGACNSTATARFNAGNFEGGCDALAWWNKGTIDGEKVTIRGLVRRREAERALCKSEL